MKIVIATHVYSPGPSQEMRKYLIQNKIDELLWISHPLFYDNKLKGSGFEKYIHGKLQIEKYSKIKEESQIKSYILHFYKTIKFVLKNKEKYDLFIGYDNLNALAGIFLKKMKKVKKTIYYVVDYSPIRFENKILNKIYHWIESYCAKNCDETWNLSQRMIDARLKFKGIKIDSKQKVVPMGIWYNEIKRYKFNEINQHQIVFVGHILEKQGIQYVLNAIPQIIKQIPDIQLIIIGDGPYLQNLKDIVSKLKINKNIEFLGFVKDQNKVNKILAKSALALALYSKEDPLRNYTYYSDPGKIKTYLGAGVPILITNVPHNAKEIQDKGCGEIVNENKEIISKKIIQIIKNKNILSQYRKNTEKYAKNFDWNRIFQGAFEK